MVPTNTVSVNPLLTSGRIPGETFQIPSGGLFYMDGELSPNVQNGEVHVYPMTGLDEILIKTPDLLFSGEAIKQIFERCIPDVIKPFRLLARDVDFLLICLRSVSFGPEVSVLHKHNCTDANENKYDVSIESFMQNVKRLDATTLSGEYQCVMPDNRIVFISPMRYQSVIDMMASINPDQDISPELLNEKMINQLSGLISKVVIPEQVEGNVEQVEVHNPEHIADWVKVLTLPHIRH